MLSIGKLAAGTGGYYTAMVASGAEEYYTGAREAPGEWVGRSAPRLGLTGEVSAEDFAAVLQRRYPKSGERVTAARSVPSVVAFDATFCAPKSVSVIHGLCSYDVRDAVREAHDVAVRAALGVLEDEAARGRRGHGGQTVVDGEGFVAGAFRHRTSRAGDPHLHTHVVAANLVYGPDDRWTALDARPLFAWAKTVGYLYEAQLRHELSRRLDVRWGPVRHGIADLDCVPVEVRREFSTRRREIEAQLEASGFDSAKAAQLAAYTTRRMKDHTATAESLAVGWQRHAAELGWEPPAIERRLENTFRYQTTRPDTPDDPAQPDIPNGSAQADTTHGSAQVDIDRMFDQLAGPDGLTRHRATFGRREVIQAICERLPDGAPAETIVDWSDQFLQSGLCRELAGRSQPVIHTRDGRTVGACTDQVRYTTPDMVATEQRLVDLALDRVRAFVCAVPYPDVNDRLRRSELSPEQRNTVWDLCVFGRGVDVVEGFAGAGKTHALGVAADLWESNGNHVIGCALAGRAARQLETDAGIPSSTIDRMLIDLDRPGSGGLGPNTVVVVDEAAMVGTRKLLRLAEHTAKADAKLVLIGDPCQLPEIDAGGAFRGLGERIGHTRYERQPSPGRAMGTRRAR